ncbi:MAG: Ig-like domain-containing protein, partial [Chitinophagaceae bacterium]
MKFFTQNFIGNCRKKAFLLTTRLVCFIAILFLSFFWNTVQAQIPTTTTVTSNDNSVCENSNIEFTATIDPGTVTDGTVEFFENGNSIGTADLNGNTATLNIENLSAGNHTITAVYSGDAGTGFDESPPSDDFPQTINAIPAPPTLDVEDHCDGTSILTASNYSGSLT